MKGCDPPTHARYRCVPYLRPSSNTKGWARFWRTRVLAGAACLTWMYRMLGSIREATYLGVFRGPRPFSGPAKRLRDLGISLGATEFIRDNAKILSA